MRNPFRHIDEELASHRFDGFGMTWILMPVMPRRPYIHVMRTDLIMEWLVDFVLTRCNFWRSAPKREKRNREERVGRQLWRIRRTRNADEYVSGMCKRAKKGGHPTNTLRKHVIYLSGDRRPCDVTESSDFEETRRKNVKPMQRAHKDGRKCCLGENCEKKSILAVR